MISVMKLFSLSVDCDKGDAPPTLFGYMGYLLCPANSIFGPWIKFSEYEKLQQVTNKLVMYINIVDIITLFIFIIS